LGNLAPSLDEWLREDVAFGIAWAAVKEQYRKTELVSSRVTHEDAGFYVVGHLGFEGDVAAKAYADLARAPSLKDCRGHRQGSVVFSCRIIKYLETGFVEGTFRHLRCGRREISSSLPIARR